jgi:inhibitor of the pro-sigma K processing machinery
LNLNVIFTFALGLILLFLVAKLLFGPLRIVGRLIWNALLGGVLLYVINVVGGNVGLHLPLNPVTALVVGFLGIPGVILLLVLQYLMV